MQPFKFRPTAANLAVSLLASSLAIFLMAMVYWVLGEPGPRWWWKWVAGILCLTFLAPLAIKLTKRQAISLSLGLLCAAILAFATSYVIVHQRMNEPPVAVLKVDSRYPTSHKPQSKLWFAQNTWWAWLPDGSGSSIWRRTPQDWLRETSLDSWLKKLPGRADVWSEEDSVRAVLVDEDQLATASLRFDAERDGYVPEGEPVIWPVAKPKDLKKSIESATIARDGTGTWWIAYDFQQAIWVRHSRDRSGSRWSDPIKLGGPKIAVDDISVMFAAAGSIGVMWGHQSGGDDEAYYVTFHRDGSEGDKWTNVEILEQGHEVAEDHFNSAVSPEGFVYVVTKDDKNVVGQPQLVLRIRHPDGNWEHHPYAERTEFEPTRPVVLLGGDPLRLYLIHGMLGAHWHDFIVQRSTDVDLSDLDSKDSVMFPRKFGLNTRSPTSTKQILPDVGPWVVLASDSFGYVYEAIIEKPNR